MAENQDTEVTLRTGKLLGFFFGMVVVCGIVFSLGYLVGKGSSQAGAPVMDSAAASNISSNGGSKPPAGHLQGPTTSTMPCNAGDANCAPATGAESAAITATPSPAAEAAKDATDS